MNISFLSALKDWRMNQAMLEDIPLYYILSNSTLEEIASCEDLDTEKLSKIAGMGERKMEKYGSSILLLAQEPVLAEKRDREENGSDNPYERIIESKARKDIFPRVLSVAECIASMNTSLRMLGYLRVRGEIFQWKAGAGGHVYFVLKDSTGKDAQIQGVIFSHTLSNLQDFAEGTEVTLVGTPDIYPKMGKLSIRVQAMELSGEGALKKAYDILKGELEDRGYFKPENKPLVPEFIQNIGIITSFHGVVFEDFKNNIGKRGYRIECIDSRVEGSDAIRDIVTAIESFSQREVDVIVLLRGGGSLESMSAFNSREVADAIFHCQKPVLCGIGHDTDIPIACLVAARNYSTPSIVAKEIDKPYMLRAHRIEDMTRRLFSNYEQYLREANYRMQGESRSLSRALGKMDSTLGKYNFIVSTYFRIAREFLKTTKNIETLFIKNREKFAESISLFKGKYSEQGLLMSREFYRLLLGAQRDLEQMDKQMETHNPERLLQLGYSILLTEQGKIVKNMADVHSGDVLVNRLKDGAVKSTAL